MHHRLRKKQKPALGGELRNFTIAMFCGAIVWLACAFSASGETTIVVNGNDPSTPVTKPSDAIDLAAYEALLKQYSGQIESAKNDPAEIARIGRSLPKIWNVQAGPASVAVSTEELRQACELGERIGDGKKEAAGAAAQRLQLMLKAAEDLEEQSKVSQGGREKQELDKVFSRTEFSHLNGPGLLQQWNAKIIKWIEKQIARIFRLLNGPPTIGRIVVWPLIVIAFLFLGILVYRMLQDRSAAAPAVAEARALPEKVRYWWREAVAAADRGDFREAVHCGYWVAITRLEERQLIPEEKTRTPREYLRMLETHPVERGILKEQTTRLERIWYGCREATAADWSNARLELEKMGCV